METWKAITGYEGFYEVSDHGLVKSLWRMVGCRAGGTRTHKELILHPKTVRSGHMRVTLCRGGVPLDFSVHRLVLEAFLGPCPEGMECCHFDGDPANNHVANLRWDTHASNMADRDRHGTGPAGSRNWRSVLTEANVLDDIIPSLGTGETHAAIARRFGVHRVTIGDISGGRSWAHITGIKRKGRLRIRPKE